MKLITFSSSFSSSSSSFFYSFLFLLISFPFILSDISISYITSSDLSEDCFTTCSSIGLNCYDNILQEMNCKSAAEELCSSKSLEDGSGTLHCDLGGCYADCSSYGYANRGTKYSTCYTEPSCHHNSASYNPVYYNFQKICPCAYITEEEDTKVHVYVWQIVGLCLFFASCALCSVQIIAILFPNLFPSRDKIYQKMGFADSKRTWTEYFTSILEYLKNTGDSIKGMFTKSALSSNSSVDGDSERGSVNSDFTPPKKEKKEKKYRKKRGQHTALNDLDESMDMQVG